MKLGVRARVFLATVGLTLFIGLSAGIVLEVRLRAELVSGVELELDRATRVLEAHLATLPRPYTDQAIDDAVDRIAVPSGLRLTVIDPDGRVMGESSRDGRALSTMDNHGTRPEVVAAARSSRGVARRRSSTLATDQLYVARKARLADNTAITIRAGKPLSQIDAAVWQLRLNLLLSALLALAAALVSAAVVSRWMQGTLERLVGRARALSGEPRTRADRGARGSVAALSGRLDAALTDLAAERDRREAVLAGVTDAVIAVDQDLVVTLLNPAARTLLGADAVGRTLDASPHAPDLAGRAHAALASDEPVTTEVRWLGPPERQLNGVIAPLQDSDGAVIVLHDLTEVRNLERVRRDFVANVSHELRTPVAIIAATTETLVGGAIDDAEAARPFTEAIHRHAVRLGHLVDDLLSLSRIEAGRLPLNPSMISVAPLARGQATTVSQVHTGRPAVEVDVDDDLQVYADRPALEHALRNLVENAVKYVPAEAAIRIHARQADDRVFIEVIDEGPGIEPSHAARIFERFYRVDRGRSRDVGGTGLGLSIVRHLAEVMGGRVELYDNAPHGCLFRIDLPASAPAE